MKQSFRQWATPLAIATFIVSAVTGILMFFHLGTGLIKPFHEWLSWALVAGVVLHTLANLKPFTAYFSKVPGIGLIAGGILITLFAIFFPAAQNGGNPNMKISKALSSSTLETVAEVAHITPEAAIGRLEKKGIKVTGMGSTIHDIATVNKQKEMMVIITVLE
jgi:hypothetical protein